jgi:hypothetical protein
VYTLYAQNLYEQMPNGDVFWDGVALTDMPRVYIERGHVRFLSASSSFRTLRLPLR